MSIPKRNDLLWPLLVGIKQLGGSATIQETMEHVALNLKLTEEDLDQSHKDGPRSEFDYQMAWARTNLKYIELINNTSRGVWTITQLGKQIESEEQTKELWRQYQVKNRSGITISRTESDIDEVDKEIDWIRRTLEIVRQIKPDAFERLCRRVLREAGFTKVEVTGRPSDQGIDGVGVLKVNLLSFHVLFQCKRYSGQITPREIREFRGAMSGRVDKGLFITTGRFTNSASDEAVRDGVQAIDLIDGESLCRLLKKYELGVKTEKSIEIKPDPEFFEML